MGKAAHLLAGRFSFPLPTDRIRETPLEAERIRFLPVPRACPLEFGAEQCDSARRCVPAVAFGGLLTSGSLVEMGPDQGLEGEVVAGGQARHWRTPSLRGAGPSGHG